MNLNGPLFPDDIEGIDTSELVLKFLIIYSRPDQETASRFYISVMLFDDLSPSRFDVEKLIELKHGLEELEKEDKLYLITLPFDETIKTKNSELLNNFESEHGLTPGSLEFLRKIYERSNNDISQTILFLEKAIKSLETINNSMFGKQQKLL